MFCKVDIAAGFPTTAALPLHSCRNHIQNACRRVFFVFERVRHFDYDCTAT
jgi:hypothetical protein